MPDPSHPTPYPDLNAVLREFAAQIQAILGDHFRGMYLSGSLALGDFDPNTSDIDFIVVTDAALADDLLAALREMHARFAAGDSPWAGKIEAVYIPQEALRHYPPPPAQYPQVEKDRPFFLDQLEGGWIYHCYILREHGVVIAGPAPRTLIDPVDPDAMRRAALGGPPGAGCRRATGAWNSGRGECCAGHARLASLYRGSVPALGKYRPKPHRKRRCAA